MHALIVQLLGCSEAESHGAKSLLISSFQYTSQPSGFVAFMKCGTPLACRMPTSFHSRLGTTARSAFRWMFLQRRRASSLVSKNPYRGKNTEPRRPGPGRRSCRGQPPPAWQVIGAAGRRDHQRTSGLRHRCRHEPQIGGLRPHVLHHKRDPGRHQ